MASNEEIKRFIVVLKILIYFKSLGFDTWIRLLCLQWENTVDYAITVKLQDIILLVSLLSREAEMTLKTVN